jgi:isopentenyl diphosphate isomerase/L-lactate dehydrogenase-like FMN-dependent dehydrogenase
MNEVSVEDFEATARKKLPSVLYDFVAGGAGDERSVRNNIQSYQQWRFIPRALRDVSQIDQSVSIFGRNIGFPIMIGPTGLVGLLRPGGEAMLARAAHDAGTVLGVSINTTMSMEDIGKANTDGRRWQQVFIFKPRDLTLKHLERAAAANYEAVILPIDCAVTGNKRRDERNGFTIPPRITMRGVLGSAGRLGWLLRAMQAPQPTFANLEGWSGAGNARGVMKLGHLMGELMDSSLTWDDLSWLRANWKGKLIVKGVLHPDDARQAIDRGADGIIVSNHGGRQLNNALAALDALPDIRAAVKSDIPVFLDSGIRNAEDALIGLCLGATAVLVGRPTLWGVAAHGQEGAARVLELLRRDVAYSMALLGVTSPSQLGPEFLTRSTR